MDSKMFLPVVESFVSINGEGAKSGQLAVFIRFKGCNLNCSYCDTLWANRQDAEFENKSISDLCNMVIDSGIKNVTLTGGEPLLQRNVSNLIDILLEKSSCDIEIETNGSISIKPWENHSSRLSFTVDYKLPGSAMEAYMQLENFDYIMNNDTVKFVCADDCDLHTAKRIIDEYRLARRCSVYLSPVFGKMNPENIVEFMKWNKMNDVKLQLQMHKFIWAPDMRGV